MNSVRHIFPTQMQIQQNGKTHVISLTRNKNNKLNKRTGKTTRVKKIEMKRGEKKSRCLCASEEGLELKAEVAVMKHS